MVKTDAIDAAGEGRLAATLERALLAPLRAMRLRYLPLLMVYFAYGAAGLVSVAQSFWIRKELTLTPAELAGIGVWLTLPWTVKMVFGQLVDSVPLFGSQRRAYVFLGAGFVAAGLLLQAGGAGGWIGFASLNAIYVAAALLMVIGFVLQDVVADAMSTEVVARAEADGSPRPREEIERELGMVQVLGRLALSFGILSVAGISGWLAAVLSYDKVFLIGLVVPLISVTGASLVRLETSERKPVDWQILGGGVLFGLVVTALGLSQVPLGQEIVFAVSLAVLCAMLIRVIGDLEPATRRKLYFVVAIIFAFRATPSVGDGYSWFSIDVLGFDEAFFGTLRQIGALIAVAATWLLADSITRTSIPRVLLGLTVLGAVLSLPNIALAYRLDLWTSETLGFGARIIALLDTAAESPLVQLSMIPLLTLTAIHAPPGRRATWFALMASLMNLALVLGQLETRYLNEWFVVDRGQYQALPALVVAATVISFAIPFAAILLFGRKAA